MSRRRRRKTTGTDPHNRSGEVTSEAPADDVTSAAVDAPVEQFVRGLRPYLELLGVAGLLVIPLSAIRILEVAGWNRETALALLANSSTSTLALALLVLAIPLAIAFWISITVIEAFAPDAKSRVLRTLSALGLIACNTMFALSWAEIAAYAFVPAIAGTALCLRARRNGGTAYREITREWVGGYAIVLAVAAFALAGSMWLPPERLVIDGEPRLGYVLKSEDDDYVVFLDKSNVVSRIPQSRVQDRQYCTIAQHNPIRRSATGLPLCPEFKWPF